MRPDDGMPLKSVERLGDDLAEAFDRVERLASVGSLSPAAPPPPPRRRTRRRLLVPMLAGAVIAFAITLIVSNDRDAGPLSTPDALAQVAKATLAVEDARPDQLTHSRFVVRSFSPYPDVWMSRPPGDGHVDWQPRAPFTAFTERVKETWISMRSTGFAVDHRGEPSYPTTTDRRRGERYLSAQRRQLARSGRSLHQEDGSASSAQVGDSPFNPHRTGAFGIAPQRRIPIGVHEYSPAELNEFPTEPRAIIRRLSKSIESYAGDPADGLWWELRGRYTPGYGVPLPAKLRAGFIEALALVPGVESLGQRNDRFGRTGLAFGRTVAGLSYELVFDRQTGTMIGSSTTVVGRDRRMRRDYRSLPVGTVVEHFELIEQRIVDRLPPAARRVLAKHRRSRR